MAAISISGLTVRFGEVLAVDNASLDIGDGEFVSIVGPSGCGKTTILNLLTGLVPLQDGRISLLGKTPSVGNPDVAYMLARDSLLPWRSALDNAAYGMEIRGVPEASYAFRPEVKVVKGRLPRPGTDENVGVTKSTTVSTEPSTARNAAA